MAPDAATPEVVTPPDVTVTADNAATVQERQWFDEEDGDTTTAPDATAEPAKPDADASETVEAEADADDAGETAEPAKPEKTDAEVAEPAKEPEAAEGDKGGKDVKPKTQPAAESTAPDVIMFDFDAAVTKAVSEPLPDKLNVGGKEVNIAQFVADFPEVTAVAATMARRMVEQAIAPIMPTFQAIQQQQQAERFFAAVEAKVPDARTVAGSQEFRDWIGKQSPRLQEMAQVNDPDSAVIVLTQFRAANPVKAAESKPAESQEFARRKQVLSGTLGTKRTTATPAKANKDDYATAFNED